MMTQAFGVIEASCIATLALQIYEPVAIAPSITRPSQSTIENAGERI